jgi:LysM repeat protein
MNKKIAGIGLCILLASAVGYADPFEDKSVSVNNSASSDLETADISVKEDTSGSSTVNSDAKDVENWILNGNSEKKDEKPADSNENTKEESPKAEETTESKTSEYTVASGDCLSAIAGRLLGDMSRWPEIVELNKDKYPSLASNPNLILVGWNLTIPGKDTDSKKDNDSKKSVIYTPTDNNVASGNNNSSSESKNNTNSDSSKTASSSDNSNSNSSSNSGGPIITPDSRVLHIGDSHSVGVYGHAIDDLMRKTGATVSTTAVAGSNPTWFMNGTVGKCGYYSKDENGKVVSPADWRTPMKTPLLQNMIDTYKPSVLVVSLGANMVGYGESSIRSQIDSICDKAKAAGCKIVWVGPPDSRSQDKNQVAKLYNVLNSEVSKYDGVVVDSRQYTKYPSSGGDGLHYSGTEGTKTANNWANSVMNAIQGK